MHRVAGAVLLAYAVLGAQSLVSPCPGCGYPPESLDANDHTGWTQIEQFGTGRIWFRNIWLKQ